MPQRKNRSQWLFLLFFAAFGAVFLLSTLPAKAITGSSPSNVQITSIQTNQVTVTWTDNTTDEASFDIERSTDGTNYSWMDSEVANATSYIDTGLTANTKYWYRIRACDSAGARAPGMFYLAALPTCTGYGTTASPKYTLVQSATGVTSSGLSNGVSVTSSGTISAPSPTPTAPNNNYIRFELHNSADTSCTGSGLSDSLWKNSTSHSFTVACANDFKVCIETRNGDGTSSGEAGPYATAGCICGDNFNLGVEVDFSSTNCIGFGTSFGVPTQWGLTGGTAIGACWQSKCCGDDTGENSYYCTQGQGATCSGSGACCVSYSCVYSGQCYQGGALLKTNDASSDDEVCIGGSTGGQTGGGAAWVDQDWASAYCQSPSQWMTSSSQCDNTGPGGICDDSDGGAFCCGDDTNEYNWYCQDTIFYPYFPDLDMAWSCLSSDTACCNNTYDCVKGGTCYANDGTTKTGLNSGGNDNWARCVNPSGTTDGVWGDCDAGGDPCGCFAPSGEASVGEYDSSGATECCGDDAGENSVTARCAGASGTSAVCCSSAADKIDASGNCVLASACPVPDTTNPTVTLTPSPAGVSTTWQNADATFTLTCVDNAGGSGCNPAQDGYTTYTTIPSSCPLSYVTAYGGSAVTVSSRIWVCGYAEDNRQNKDQTDSSVEFKIEKVAPKVDDMTVNTSAATPQAPTTDTTPTIGWTVSDTGGSNLLRVEIWRRDSACSGTAAWNNVSGTIAASGTSSTGSWPDTARPDGTYCYGVHVVDVAGNVADEDDVAPAQGPIEIVIDTTPPPVPTCTPPGANFTSTISVDCTDSTSGATTYYTTSGTSPTCSSSAWADTSFSVTTTLKVTACDTLGNKSAENTYIYTKGSVPNTSITVNPPDPSNDATPTFNFTGTNSPTSFMCKLDSAANQNTSYASCTSPKTYTTSVNEGARTFSVYAINDFGDDSGSPATYSWTLDTTNPVCGTVTYTPPLSQWTQGPTGVSVVCTDTGSGCVQSPYTKSPSPTSNGSGTITIADAAGNSASCSYNVTNIDTTAPSASFAGDGSTCGEITWTISGASDPAGGSGLHSTPYSFDGTNWSTALTSVESVPGGGSRTKTAYVRDTALNQWSSTKTVSTAGCDTSKPTVTVTGAPGAWQNTNGSACVTCVDNAGGSGCNSSKDTLRLYTTVQTSCPATYNAVYDYTACQTVSSQQWACAYGEDNSGNWDNDGPIEFKVDKTAPTVVDMTVNSSATTPQPATNDATPTVGWDVSDAGGSDLLRVEIWRRDSACSGSAAWVKVSNDIAVSGASNQGSWPDTARPDGTYCYGVHVVDTATNSATESDSGQGPIEVVIDTAAPPVPSCSPTPGTYTSTQNVTLSSSGASQIRYNLGSPAPTTCSGGILYAGAITVSSTETINSIACDSAGNKSSAIGCTYTIGNICNTSISSNPADPTNSTSASFSFTGTNSPTSFDCRIDSGGWATCTSPKSYSSLSQAIHTFDVRCINAFGTDATPASYTWLIDTTRPTVAGGSFTVTPDPSTGSFTIAWNVSDTGGSNLLNVEVWRAPDVSGAPGTWTQVSTTNAPANSNGPWTSSATNDPGNGIWWYGIHVTDNATNCALENNTACGGAGAPIRVVRDNQPPTPDPSTGTTLVNSCTSITWTINPASDALSGLHATPYSFDNGGSWQISNVLTESTLSGGVSYSKQIRARDVAGNRTTAGTLNAATPACAGPTLTANPQNSNGWKNSATSVNISAVDTDGVTQAKYLWDNSDAKNSGTVFTAAGQTINSPTTNGSHTLYLWGIDDLNNESSASYGTYDYDGTRPTIVNTPTNSFTVTPPVISGSGSFTITWNVSDTGGSHLQNVEIWRAPDSSGVPGNWGTSPVKTVAAPAGSDGPWNSSTTDDPGDGTWWYGIHITDGATNCTLENGVACGGSGAPIQVTKSNPASDITPPTITSVTASSPDCNTIRFTINGASDSGVGLHQLPYSFDGAVTWQAGNTWDVTATSYTIPANQIKVRDANSNMYSHASVVSGSASACAGSNFNIIVVPVSPVVNQGSNANYTVSVTPINGFTSSVSSWTVQNCPAGASCTFNPTTPCTQTSYSNCTTLTITTGSVTPGTYQNITVGGTGGSITRTSNQVALVVNPGGGPDTTPPTITSVTASSPFCSRIRFTINGAADAGVGLHQIPYSFDGGVNWQVGNTFDVDGTSYTLASNQARVRDADGNVYIHASAVSGTASACSGANFNLMLSPASPVVNQGTNAVYTINVSALNGFNASIGSFTVQNCPPGASCTVSPASCISPYAGCQLTITTGSVAVGSYAGITVTGTGGSNTRTSNLAALVVNAGSGGQDLTPPTISSVTFSSPACSTIRFTINGAADSGSGLHVTPYSFDGGVNWQAGNTSDVTGTSYTIPANQIQVKDADGNIYIHSSAVSGSATACSAPNFNIVIVPVSPVVNQGSNANYTVSVTPINGFTSSVSSWTVQNCPAGASCTFNPTTPCTSGSYANCTTLTITTGSVAPGTYQNITVGGTGGSNTRTSNLFVIIVNPASGSNTPPVAPTLKGPNEL